MNFLERGVRVVALLLSLEFKSVLGLSLHVLGSRCHHLSKQVFVRLLQILAALLCQPDSKQPSRQVNGCYVDVYFDVYVHTAT